MTKHSPTRATEAYISIVGHITIDELQRKLDETAMANGFANRFLLGCVRRAQLSAARRQFPGARARAARQACTEALTAARTIARVQMTAETRERWNAEYPALAKSGNNLTDHMTARAEAQVIRLALIYALLDRRRRSRLTHLEPALALWRFCQASTRYIFGELTGDSPGDVILRALRSRARRTGKAGHLRIVRAQSRGRQDRCRLGPAAGERQGRQPADRQRAGAGRRPKQMWYAVERAK